MSYLKRIQQCHHYHINQYLPFKVNQETIGWIRPSFAEHLKQWPDVFSNDNHATEVSINPTLNTPEKITQAIAPICQQLHIDGIIDSWVGEKYPVIQAFNEQPRFHIERAATHYFGLRSFGIHINGLVKKSDDSSGDVSDNIWVWTGKRSTQKPFWPGKLDQMVAGGQPAGLSLEENLIKESAEEANVPEALAKTSQYITTLHYCSEGKRGINPDTLFVYDLWLPEDFEPENTDGEVEAFTLLSINELADLTEHTHEFKDNCSLVNIDLLLRLGVINKEHSDYESIKTSLYQPGKPVSQL